VKRTLLLLFWLALWPVQVFGAGLDLVVSWKDFPELRPGNFSEDHPFVFVRPKAPDQNGTLFLEGGPDAPPTDRTLEVRNLNFDPAYVVANAGDRFRVVNHSTYTLSIRFFCPGKEKEFELKPGQDFKTEPSENTGECLFSAKEFNHLEARVLKVKNAWVLPHEKGRSKAELPAGTYKLTAYAGFLISGGQMVLHDGELMTGELDISVKKKKVEGRFEIHGQAVKTPEAKPVAIPAPKPKEPAPLDLSEEAKRKGGVYRLKTIE